MEIKYSHALDSNGTLVHISEAVKGDVYICPGCGNELVAKLGDVNAHHFAHKTDCTCNGESYLHKIAKLKFKEIFDNSTEFTLEFLSPTECAHHYGVWDCRFMNADCYSHENTVRRLDIKRVFDTCVIEGQVNGGEYVADILLKDSSGKTDKVLMIEFYHTHKCDSEKIKSGLPIVEIKIDNEDDIISSNYIRISKKVSFYGFKPRRSNGKDLYYVSFDDDDASDITVSLSNCNNVFDCNYNDSYDCSSTFAVAIDAMSYHEFSSDSRFKNNPPSVEQVACAIAYQNGFKDFENCAVCLLSRRSQYKVEDLWCREIKSNPELLEIPKRFRAFQCDQFIRNINRLKFIVKHLRNLKYQILRCKLPDEYDD